jgi:glutamate carboxypeptidase
MEDGKAFGPGVFDMKCGLLLCLMICQAFHTAKVDPGKTVIFFFTSDEEVGTTVGLPLLKPVAESCRAVLCLEPPLPGGKVKTFRRGVGDFRLRVTGVAAHAGVDHEKGASAILELSKMVLHLEAMTNYARGITINVGKFTGGTISNVVPAFAEAEVDLRFSSAADARALEQSFRSLRPSDSRCILEIDGGINRLPLERTPAVVSLYEKARSIAAEMGWDLGEGGTGGSSDGSFTAALGIPTLDGLGVDGDGAHAAHEHIHTHDIPRRAALLCRLIGEL